MPQSPETLAHLVERVNAFRIGDRSLRLAHETLRTRLAGNEALDEAEIARYRHLVARYFESLESEASHALRDVDRRLVQIDQQRMNFASERGVIVKRIEETRILLDELRAFAAPTTT